MAPSTENLTQTFLQQMEKNTGIVYKVAHSYCWDPEDRKDLIQEINIQAWRSFPRFDSKYQFSTWLYRVALNVAISALRKEKKRAESTELSPSLMDQVGDESGQSNRQINALYRAIGDQNPINRAIILLHLEEKSYAEISDILGISQTNVATKLSRIKKEIKEKLNPTRK